MVKKTDAQLNREIDEFLSKRPALFKKRVKSRRNSQRHHETVHISDEWDVVMDALLEHDPKRAAQIWRGLRKEHGFVTAPETFHAMLREVPSEVRWKFEEYIESPESGPKHLVVKGKRIPVSSVPRAIHKYELERPYVVRENGQLYVIDQHDRGRVAHLAKIL